jgi:hypothetical protein
MPANIHLMSGLGAGGAFRLAGSCPVAAAWANGAYMSHQGGDDHLVADIATKGGTAAVRLVLWRCVHCGTLIAGLGHAAGEPRADQEFTWAEEKAVLLDGGPGSQP